MRSLPNTGLNIYIPIMLSRSEEMTTGWVRGSTDPLGDGLVLKSHWSPSSLNLHLDWWPTVMSPGIGVAEE